MPYKYQHNSDPALAELLHTVTVEGWGNDSSGDVQEDGFAASLLLIEPAEQQELADAFGQPVPAGNYVVHEDQQGFVTVEQYPTPFHARLAFTGLAAQTGPGEEDATITPTGPLGAWYGVGLGGRFLGEARDLDQALTMLREAMDADQVWPDVWFHQRPRQPPPHRPRSAMSDWSIDDPLFGNAVAASAVALLPPGHRRGGRTPGPVAGGTRG